MPFIATEPYEFDLQSELDRKFLETCAVYEDRLNRGDIDERDFSIAIEALYDTLNGLVCREGTQWIDARLATGKPDRRNHCIFQMGNSITIFSFLSGEAKVIVRKGTLSTAFKSFDYEDLIDGNKEIKNTILKLRDGLIKRGHKEI